VQAFTIRRLSRDNDALNILISRGNFWGTKDETGILW